MIGSINLDDVFYAKSFVFITINYFSFKIRLYLFILPWQESFYYLIFRKQTSIEQSLCQNRKFFRVVTFRDSYFFGGVIAQNKDIYRRTPLIEAGTSAQHQLFQKSFIFEKPTFPGELPFQGCHFFKRRYFLQQQPFLKGYFLTTYFFRRVAISKLNFLSTATLIIYQLAIKRAPYELSTL